MYAIRSYYAFLHSSKQRIEQFLHFSSACINLGDKVFMYNTEDVYTEKLSQFSEIELLSEYVRNNFV